MKRRLKPFVIPTMVSIGSIMVIAGAYLGTINLPNSGPSNSFSNIDYVTDTILENNLPVINATTKVINPYVSESVTTGKTYYDYNGDAASQEKSIIYHDNIYMQNSGIDYVSNDTFDVVAVLNGTVLEVKDNETLGKIIEIQHENNYVSTYQSLSEVTVKKGDVVSQGQVIGKSGTNELDKDLGNHLHFEFYANGQVVNPNLYLNKELS